MLSILFGPILVLHLLANQAIISHCTQTLTANVYSSKVVVDTWGWDNEPV
jgi:hypothetical protein